VDIYNAELHTIKFNIVNTWGIGWVTHCESARHGACSRSIHKLLIMNK